ncbi:MAG: hypothetical protein M1481_05965 [Candidatus Thermoplasmatota archaeon]|jgi:hypothetical protein|nr:hypothetical protein [Candidatus Thermoplasmatota archaeon]MCL5962964.1 hypothetical protein [Candidatus Thermoplasmatota archaeon]
MITVGAMVIGVTEYSLLYYNFHGLTPVIILVTMFEIYFLSIFVFIRRSRTQQPHPKG